MAKAAVLIHKEIKEMKDEMPWPPQPSDLEPEKFGIPEKLRQLLTILITGQDNEGQMTSRSARLRHSLAQDIVYSVTKGRSKPPKSLLLPSIIK